MKTSETSILGEELIKEVNQGLREGLKVFQKLVDNMTTEEHVAAVKDSLDLTIEGINNLRHNHATVDTDVLESFGMLIKDIKNFNKLNKADLIPIPKEVNEILSDIKTPDADKALKNKVDKIVGLSSTLQTVSSSTEVKTPSPTPKVNNPKPLSKQH
jgi:hypothetical protein